MRYCVTLLIAMLAAPAAAADTVVLLHGLARSSSSMQTLAQRLGGAGYEVLNLDYPSTDKTVEQLVEQDLAPALSPVSTGNGRLHFVTHSMGGILVRQYLKAHELPALGRVVMLGPPNQGSELVDHMGRLRAFDWINGPAGKQLGTGADSLPNRLGPVGYAVGIIAGTRSYNPYYSSLLPGPDDGKVAVARARLEGMSDFIELPVSHTLMMNDEAVVKQVLHFLAEGRFSR